MLAEGYHSPMARSDWELGRRGMDAGTQGGRGLVGLKHFAYGRRLLKGEVMVCDLRGAW